MTADEPEPKQKTPKGHGIPIPKSPFPPSVEGFQVILLAGAVHPQASLAILSALEDDQPDGPRAEERA